MLMTLVSKRLLSSTQMTMTCLSYLVYKILFLMFSGLVGKLYLWRPWTGCIILS